MGLVKNRQIRLREVGKIKIGGKGPERKAASGKMWHPPEKYDHFVITTLEIGADSNFVHDVELMGAIGTATDQDPQNLKRLPVQFLFNDPELNWASRYAVYEGKSVFCSGDGELARRRQKDGETFEDMDCPCERLDANYNPKEKCKLNGLLTVMIEGAPQVGGIWKFRTTSFNSTDFLTGELMFLQGATGGQLAGIPFDLVVNPKKVTDPKGKQQTIYVVGLEFRGSMKALREMAQRLAMNNSQRNLQIEADARKMLSTDEEGVVFTGEEGDGVQEEFYPQQPPPPAIADPQDNKPAILTEKPLEQTPPTPEPAPGKSASPSQPKPPPKPKGDFF